MHIKKGENRQELMMMSYDMMISPDNPVRLIDLMCKKFISDNPWREEWKGSSTKGCKSYPPGALLSLLVYGYFNKINSSRHLEKETQRNIEVLWLMEGLQPDHWTICAFRRENKQLVKELLKSFRTFLLDQKYASSKRLVFDGSKLKAYANRNMLTEKGIDKKLENLDKSIAEYLLKLEHNDIHGDELESAREEIKELKAKIDKLEKQKNKIEAAKEVLECSGQKQISPNDTDAVLVKGRDGKFAGYNGQAGVDSKGHFIMHNEIKTEAIDQQQLENCVAKAEKEMDAQIEEAIADKGYGNTTQILDIESKGPQCFVPLAISSREKEESKGFVFIYDKPNDTYICPQGNKLTLYQKNHKHNGAIYNRYKCHDYEGCPIRNQCTKSKTGRIYKRNVRQEEIDKYKQKLETDYSKKRIAERKGVVEHPFGTIKWMMGKFNFLLTGKEKVQTEFDLYATAYNP
ncbi:MAG: IS1182 family transposase [Bacteroidota bacterium]